MKNTCMYEKNDGKIEEAKKHYFNYSKKESSEQGSQVSLVCILIISVCLKMEI